MHEDVKLIHEWRVPSFTLGGDVIYGVQEYSDGTLVCDCPAYKFYSEDRGPCKHIRAVQRGDFANELMDIHREPVLVETFEAQMPQTLPDGRVLVPYIVAGWPETGRFVMTLMADLLELGVPWSTLWARYGDWLVPGLTAMDLKYMVQSAGRVVLKARQVGSGFENPYQVC